MSKVKRQQYEIPFFNLSQMFLANNVVTAQRNVILLKDGTSKDMSVKGLSESRLIRKFGAENFAIVTVDEKADALMLDLVLLDGFVFEGHVYRRVLRSASQMRTAKAVFTRLDVEMVREAMVYGATFASKDGKVNIAKKEARYGLALSSTIEVDVKFSHTVIADFEREIKLEGRRLNASGELEDFSQQEKLNFTDGQGYIDYATAKKVAKELGLNYVPTAFQVRFAGAKGLLIVWKWNKQRKGMNANVLFHESMWKYTPDFSKYSPKLEIADYVKPARSAHVAMSYQFLQILDITGEELISLAKESLDKLNDGVLKNPDAAMKFLGMIDTSEGEYSDKIVSRLQKTLDANPKMLNDAYVQRGIRKLLKKFITDMRKGRVPVMGAWKYVVCDPTVVFGKKDGVLNAGDVYFNNQTGVIAGFRSPLIHSSEANKFNRVEVKDFVDMQEKDGFEYLKDLVVLNSHDDACPRMGGMDKDGDKILITSDTRIINAVRGGKLIYDEGKSGSMLEDNMKNLIMYDKQTFSPSRIGFITDWATIWIDGMNHKKSYERLDENVQFLRVLQGQEIDAAKTGYTPEIPEHLQLKIAPHWMEKLIDGNEQYKPVRENGMKQYHSTSPIGQLYDFIVGVSEKKLYPNSVIYREDGYWAQFLAGNPLLEEKRSLELLMNVDRAEVLSVHKYVTRLENMYRHELAALRDQEQVLSADDLDDLRNSIFEKYTQLIDDIDADPATVATSAYQIAYNENDSKQRRSVSFPWICAFDGLLLALSGIADKRFKMVPVRGDKVVAGEMTFAGKVNKETGSKANVPNGTYEVVEFEGRFFAKVKRTGMPLIEKKARRTQQHMAFVLRGFKFYGHTATTAVQAIQAANGEIVLAQDGSYILAYADGQPVAAVATENDFDVAMLINKKVRMMNTPVTTFVSTRDHKTYQSGQIDVQVSFIEEVEVTPAPSESTDFAQEFANFGFESVTPTLFDGVEEDGACGALHIQFNGKTYAYRFGAAQGMPVLLTPVKNDVIRQSLTTYLNDTYDFIA